MSLFEKRAEAAAEAMSCRWVIPKEGHPKHEHCKTLCIPLARAALLAADAVVTEEQIAEVLHDEVCDCGADAHDEPYNTQAKAVLSLFRGGAK